MCVELQSLVKIKLTDDPFRLNQLWLPFLSNKGNMINYEKSVATAAPVSPTPRSPVIQPCPFYLLFHMIYTYFLLLLCARNSDLSYTMFFGEVCMSY